MEIFYQKLKKYNKIQFTKKWNGHEQQKNDKSSKIPRGTSVFPNTCELEQQECNKIKNDEEGKKRGVSMERRKEGKRARKEEVPTTYRSLPNRNTIIINTNIVIFYRILKNYNEINITKNKMDSNN